MDFFVNDLSNWYVRLNRHRFYDVDGADNRAAFATLHEVLVVTCRLLAPIAPFITDWVHTELTGESVHLTRYSRPEAQPRDAALEQKMDHVRALATLGRAAREDAGIKVRQPLQRMVCVVPGSATRDGGEDGGAGGAEGAGGIGRLIPLLADELNVKEISFLSSADALVTLEAKPNFRTLGKKFGKQTPLAAEAVAKLTSDALTEFEKGGALSISVAGDERSLDEEDLVIVRRAAGNLVVKEEGGYFAAIDPMVSPELRAEGLAREIVSRIQRMRKEAGLAVSDRIALWIAGPSEIEEAVRTHAGWIAEEVLARQLKVGERFESHHVMQSVDIDGQPVSIAFERAV
jgi:isoleucyl-tRNA synthetase